jgi:hypothetical protein
VTLPNRLLKVPPLPVTLSDFPRIIRSAYGSRPLGMSFGPSRFSSVHGRFQVLYAAAHFETALAEAVIRDRFVARQRRYIGRATLASRSVVLITTVAALSLFDARGEKAYALGIQTDAVRGQAHTAGQAFSDSLHAETAVDGILYDSRLTGGVCVAVYERAISKVVASPAMELIRHAGLFPELQRLGITVRLP